MSSVHTTPEKFENTTITGHFECTFEENSGRKITRLSTRYRFRKAPSLKCLPSTLKHKAGVFKFLRFEERFKRLRFRVGLVWTVARPNRRNKAPFTDFSGIVGTGPKLIQNTCVLHSPENL